MPAIAAVVTSEKNVTGYSDRLSEQCSDHLLSENELALFEYRFSQFQKTDATKYMRLKHSW